MYNKTVLDNGIRIVTEEINHVRSVSLGVWVESGSRYENPVNNGVAHFIEHMLFKGTEGRSAFDIASAIDSVGGVMNAFTGKELTSFYVKVPDYHCSMAIELLADIFHHSRFDPEEIDKEKSVVIQEINMLEDTPDEYIHDFFGQIFWDAHPLGLPILGTAETVNAFHRQDIVGFFSERYSGDNLIITAAGNLNHDVFADMIENVFGSFVNKRVNKHIVTPAVASQVAVLNKNLEQVHVVIGTLAPSATSDVRYAAFLMNTVLGGSMSSRLFQEIREKRGLAYSIHSFLVPYKDSGMYCVYFGTSEKNVIDVIKLVMDELNKVCDGLLSDSEIDSAKEQMKGNFLLSMESTDVRMTRLAKNEIYFARNIHFDEVVDNIDAVTIDAVRAIACDMFRPEILSMAVLGRVKREDFPARLLRS
ncbi:MAG TPA: insulinase family protein [Deltaproteobacteria bacterium]|nr:insulinase family protein [Deltaproteobacteria bacterium]